MPATSVQFTVAAHIMATLGFFPGNELASATLAECVNADPSFVRKSLSKLSEGQEGARGRPRLRTTAALCG